MVAIKPVVWKYANWILRPMWSMGEDEILMCSIALNGKAVTIVRRDFLFKNNVNGDEKFFEILDKDIPQVRGEWGYDVELVIVDNEIDVISETF